jgi:hypothetical protein
MEIYQEHLKRVKKVGRWVTTLVLSTISMVYFMCLNFERDFTNLLPRKREKPFNFMKLSGTIRSYERIPVSCKQPANWHDIFVSRF